MKRLSAMFLMGACLVSACDSRPAAPPPAAPAATPAPTPLPELPALTQESASNFARITLKCVRKEYPNSPGCVFNAPGDVQPPSKVHPAFYGCYDWHSSLHGHWMLARLLRLFPDLPEKDQIVRALDANLTAANV